jgi:hypothetical protein
MMTKRQTVAYFLVAFVMLLIATMSCVSTQPPSQERQLQATISALETQVTLRQQLGEPTATPVTQQSQEQQLQATIAALQTQVAQPPIQPPSSPSTAIPIPMPTFPPDTPPNSVLEVGQSWRQQGLELRLSESVMGTFWGQEPCVTLLFELTNRKPYEVTIRYDLGKDVSAMDNLGRRLKTDPYYSSGYEFGPVNVVVQSGKTIRLIPVPWCTACDEHSLTVLVEATNPDVTEVIVTISIPGYISDARWRIPILH